MWHRPGVSGKLRKPQITGWQCGETFVSECSQPCRIIGVFCTTVSEATTGMFRITRSCRGTGRNVLGYHLLFNMNHCLFFSAREPHFFHFLLMTWDCYPESSSFRWLASAFPSLFYIRPSYPRFTFVLKGLLCVDWLCGLRDQVFEIITHCSKLSGRTRLR